MPLAAWIAVIFWFSLTPDPPRIPSGLLAWDKLHHAMAYGVLTLLAGWAFVPRCPDGSRPWILAWLLAALTGTVLELLQAWATVNRTGELGDLAANLVGASMVLALAGYACRRKRRTVL